MYELFNSIPDVVCERVFLPDSDELEEYEKTGTPLLSLETQSRVKGFDVVAFSISFETDYLNMARMLQLSGIPGLGKRTKRISIRSSSWAARRRFSIPNRSPISPT